MSECCRELQRASGSSVRGSSRMLWRDMTSGGELHGANELRFQGSSITLCQVQESASGGKLQDVPQSFRKL
eukprot:15437442-Alexandrium_andersonii.AAC.1